MFYSLWWFALLLILPLLAYRYYFRREATGAIEFSSLAFIADLQPTLRQKLMWLPSALMLASLTLIVIGLARPRFGQTRTVVSTDGIAIEMIVDCSPSMTALDFTIDDQEVDRLTAVKNVASRFIMGDDSVSDLNGRTSDLIGLTVFSGYADNISPLTLDHTFLISKLRESEIATIRSDGGTAIGDAIGSAVEKLASLDEGSRKAVKSKIVILLTDGENNAGTLEPKAAAELAQALGIKVYTIGVGTDKGMAKLPVTSPFSGRQMFQSVPVSIDEETLTQVAETTGGKYFRATDTDSLINIYREIDLLEKTKVEANHFSDYRELAVQSYRLRSFLGFRVPPVLMIAFVLLLAKLTLERTWLREFG